MTAGGTQQGGHLRDGRTVRVVVTGATGAVGRAVARRLAAEGAAVVLVARDAEKLERLAAELPGRGHRWCALDVRDQRAWEEALPAMAPEGWLSGVVTAAARLEPVGPLGTWDVGAFRETLDVNVVGTLLALSTTADCLAAAGGAVVTFSGGGGTSPLVRYDAYAASKAAVVRLSENLAGELATRGIRVNSVAPGFVASAMHQVTLAAGAARAGEAYFARTQKALKAGGDSPERAAALVAFLLSDQARGITGKLLSAPWDPWEDPAFLERLRTEPDLATLRRIDDQFFAALPRGES